MAKSKQMVGSSEGKGARKVQHTVLDRAKAKAAKKAAKAAKRQVKREITHPVLLVASVLVSIFEEHKRAVVAKIARQSKADDKRQKRQACQARQQSLEFGRLASRERSYTVRLRFVARIPVLTLVKLSDPAGNANEARDAAWKRRAVSKAIRAETERMTGNPAPTAGLTADGSLPGLTYSEARAVLFSVAGKVGADSVQILGREVSRFERKQA